MTKSMDTESFILALGCFIAIRDNVKTIQCDIRSNFVGVERELEKSMEEVNHNKIQSFIVNQNTDWIVWKRNPTLASHVGGVWERPIESARSIVSSLLRTQSSSLAEESLNTLILEVEAVIN